MKDVSVTDNRFQIARVFNAPRHLVFGWWSQAEKLQQWSGCKEATRCEVVMDFRVGGVFSQKMQLAVNGGTCEFSFTGTYEEIVEPERIVYRADLGAAVTQVTVEFFDHGNATKVVLTQQGFPNEFLRQNVSQGTSESFDKLERLVAGRALVTPV